MAIYNPESNQHSDGSDSEVSIPQKPVFVVKVNDGFCEWEFGLLITNKISIQDIIDGLIEKFPGTVLYGKCVKEDIK